MKVGIDLGTTFSLIARMERNGRPNLLPDSSFKDIYSTPSTVYISEKQAAVGFLVDTLIEQNPDLPVIRFFKRSFGKNEPLFIDKNSNKWYPDSIAALVLKKLKYDAEAFTGNTIESAVITVPAHFTDPQRKSVLNAAAMADIPVLGIVEEPVAAALHYGVISKSNDQIIVVYDLGGGTFDATILSIDSNGVYVLAKDGLTEMGGKEFDDAITSMILDQFKKATGKHLEMNGLTSIQLRRIAEEVKIELSIPNKAFLKKTILIGGAAFEVLIYRRDFENAIKRMVELTIEVMLRCIDGAGILESDIHALMLVGGSSMIPFIRERLSKVISSPQQKIFLHEPMKAVALGAAIHAAQLGGDASKYDLPAEFRGVTGYNIGIQTVNPQTRTSEIDCLIRKNMPLPSRATRTYYTSSSNQTRIVLQLVQYLSLSDEIVNIGEMIIGPLQNPTLNYPVEITVENLVDGTVKVEAYDPGTGIELEQVFGKDIGVGGSHLLAQKNLVRSTLISNFSHLY